MAAASEVNRVTADTYDHPNFKNSAYVAGHIIGEKIKLNRLLGIPKRLPTHSSIECQCIPEVSVSLAMMTAANRTLRA